MSACTVHTFWGIVAWFSSCVFMLVTLASFALDDDVKVSFWFQVADVVVNRDFSGSPDGVSIDCVVGYFGDDCTVV